MTMKNVKIVQPYAEALINIASEEGSFDEIIKDLLYIKRTLSDSNGLNEVLANPILSTKTKKEILESVFTDNVKNTLVKLLMVLCDCRRISYLLDVVQKALELAYKKASIEVVSVTSSVKLNAYQEEELTKKLQKMTGATRVDLESIVDQSLLGGFVIQIGSKVIDSSIKGQLKRLAFSIGTSLA